MTERHETYLFEAKVASLTFTQAAPAGLEAMVVEDHVDMMGMAQLTFGTGLTDWSVIAVGDEVEIRVGKARTPVFVGVVTGHQHLVRGGRESLVVVAMDPLVRLAASRRTEIYEEVADSDIVRTVLGRAGVEAGDIDSTGQARVHVMQRNESDLDFLKRLAARNHCLLMARQGKVHFTAPQVAPRPLEVTSQEVERLDYAVSAVRVPPKLTVVGWDPQAAQKVEGSAGATDLVMVGSGTPATEIATRLWSDQAYVSDVVVDAQSDAKSIAVAELERLARSFVRGHVTVVGRSDLVAGATLRLVGQREGFNPTGFVISARHRFEVGRGYTTEVQFCSNTLPT